MRCVQSHSPASCLAHIIHDGSSPFDLLRVPSPVEGRNRWAASWDLRAGSRGLAPPSVAVPVPLFIRQGQAPQRMAPRPNSTLRVRGTSPSAVRCVVTALAKSSALWMLLARRKNTAMSSDFRIRDCSRSAHE